MRNVFVRYRISAISYANTLPFVYGLTHAPERPDIELMLDTPAECAMHLKNNVADIGLIPVGALQELPYYEILPGFCLGANGPVRTVMLFSTVPVQKVKKIHLDPQSRTSNLLIRLLARDFWNIFPEWVMDAPGQELEKMPQGDARVLIGDRVFYAESLFPYQYDGAEEWKKFTSLPFVFGVWAANKPIAPDFVKQFNLALKYGVNHIPEAVALNRNTRLNGRINLVTYLTSNLSYPLDNMKMVTIHKFLDLIRTL